MVHFAIVGEVIHADCVGLDGDAALPFEVHGIEDLLLHLTGGERTGQLKQTVRKRGFAMIDVGDNGEVPDVGGVHGVIFDFSS